jgi:hypothetical protein
VPRADRYYAVYVEEAEELGIKIGVDDVMAAFRP